MALERARPSDAGAGGGRAATDVAARARASCTGGVGVGGGRVVAGLTSYGNGVWMGSVDPWI